MTACASGCTRPNEHDPGDDEPCEQDCACHRGNGTFRPPCDIDGGCGPHPHDPQCPGCRPRQAAPGARVCITCINHTYDALTGGADRPSLPELHTELLDVRYAIRTSDVKSTSWTTPLPEADAPRLTRQWIHGVLLEWCRVLSAGRQITYPASDNTVKALTTRLTIHADWLLAHHEHADQFVHDITAMYAAALDTARPRGPQGLTLGACPIPTPRVSEADATVDEPCGAPLRAYPQQPIGTCPGCGTSADVYWWRARLTETPDAVASPVADAYVLAPWLSALWMRPITVEVIQQWARRGTRTVGRLPIACWVTPLLTDDGDPVLVRRRDTKGRTLYPLEAARDYTEALYGPAPDPT